MAPCNPSPLFPSRRGVSQAIVRWAFRALDRLGPAIAQESCFFGPRLQKKHLQQEKECLMSKLVEAEMDGAAAAKQVMALKDTIGKLKTVGGAFGWGGWGCGGELYAVIRLTL